MTRFPVLVVAIALAAALPVAGCGGSSKNGSAGGSGQAPGALSAEAQSAATGDIPDNQVFLTFRDRAAGFSMRYPEGWAVRGSGGKTTFQDKNNLIRVLIAKGTPPQVQTAEAELARLRASDPSLRIDSVRRVTVNAVPAVKVVYSTRSAPNAVTGKRVTLIVDRYELARAGKRAVIDLGTPRGVDNVDAYRMIIQSFRWL